MLGSRLRKVSSVYRRARFDSDGCANADTRWHEASLELRARGYMKPIVTLTAHAMLEEKQRSHEIGYNDYLTKPVDSLKLIRTILNHMRRPSEGPLGSGLHSIPLSQSRSPQKASHQSIAGRYP